jgi:voltage-gated potassium channel
VNERAQRLDDRLEPLYLVAALLVIPDVVIESTTARGGWAQIALILNWTVWLVFAVGLVWTLLIADARWRWLRERPLDVAIVVLTPPFAPAALLGFRLARLLRLLRLLRLARTAHLARKTFSLEGVKWVAALSALVALGGGAAFAALERGHGQHPPASTADGMWWAISTMTTVGYGDYAPVTGGGRIIAAGVMLVGIGFVALPDGGRGPALRRPDRRAQTRMGRERSQRPAGDQGAPRGDRGSNAGLRSRSEVGGYPVFRSAAAMPAMERASGAARLARSSSEPAAR